ncbi:MAG: hypothetical protein ACRDK9_11240 [Solirubrobacterales bacterium]
MVKLDQRSPRIDLSQEKFAMLADALDQEEVVGVVGRLRSAA